MLIGAAQPLLAGLVVLSACVGGIVCKLLSNIGEQHPAKTFGPPHEPKRHRRFLTHEDSRSANTFDMERNLFVVATTEADLANEFTGMSFFGNQEKEDTIMKGEGREKEKKDGRYLSSI